MIGRKGGWQALLQQMAMPEDGQSGGGLIGPVKLAPAKALGKNGPAIQRLQELLARLCGGHDATQIPGLGTSLVLQIVSEVGTDMSAWETQKGFVSWLGLAAASFL